MPKFPSTGQPGQYDGPQEPDTPSTPDGGRTAWQTPSGGAPGRAVAGRRKQFLIAPAAGNAAMAPFALGGATPAPTLQNIEQALRNDAEIEVVRTVGTRNLGPMDAGPGGYGGVLVARMTDDRADALQQQGGPQLRVERDHYLQLLDPVPRQPALVTPFDAYGGPRLDIPLIVVGKDGTPLPDAEVTLFGGLLPAVGRTDAQGQVMLSVYGDPSQAISGLYVKPRADYWSFYLREPDLSSTEPNVVTLRPLSEVPALQGFPRRSAVGWGERAMRLDQLPTGLRGEGVKVAVIDSGAATTHANLNRIHSGFDIVNDNPDTWTEDVLSHGSHCAGVIAGADPSFGIRGFAPDAEIHAFKLFPGGQISQLIEALEYCIERQIDVVNLSLGGTAPSAALEAQILRAKRAGVACIVAAGNSGGPVQYPAASPNVLAVAAIGRIGEFPRDSYHAETINLDDVDAQGFFTAKFSCRGPEIDVCAPGVAIVSSVPPNNFAAWDGTSMAAPHITGLAALMLAHHGAFQGPGRLRSEDRVERLFQLIRMSARRVSLADSTHIGYGLPDALVALGLAVAPGQQAYQTMLGSLMAGLPLGGIPVAQPGMARPQGGAAPFSFGSGGPGLQGW